jgi:hypothetical protein
LNCSWSGKTLTWKTPTLFRGKECPYIWNTGTQRIWTKQA